MDIKDITQSDQQDSFPKPTALVPVTAETLNVKLMLNETDNQRARVDGLKFNLETIDTMALVNFGDPAVGAVGKISDRILAQIRVKDAGAAGTFLNQLLQEAGSINPLDLLKPKKEESGISRLFKRAKNKAEEFLQQFQTVEDQVDKVEAELVKQRNSMARGIKELDEMYEENSHYLTEFLVSIRAGELVLVRMEKMIRELEEHSAASGNPVDAQKAQDYRSARKTLEQRLFDLKLLAVISLDSGPQIRMIAEGNKTLLQKISQSISTTIPLWKRQIALAIQVYRQQEALEVQGKVTDMTNTLLAGVQQISGQAAIATARAGERPVIDIETLKKAHDGLLATMGELKTIEEQGRAMRIESEKALTQIASETIKSLQSGNLPQTQLR